MSMTAEGQPASRRGSATDLEPSRNWPDQVFEKLREADIRQVTYVPDAGHARLIELCHAEPSMRTQCSQPKRRGSACFAGHGSAASAACF